MRQEGSTVRNRIPPVAASRNPGALVSLARRRRRVRAVLIGAAALAFATRSDAVSLVTTDPVAVSAFVGSDTRFGFDDVTGSAGGLGSAVPAGAAIAANYQSDGILISSTGGPAYAAARAVDAVSDPNLLGGTNRNASNVLITAWLEPVTIDFVKPGTTTPATTTRVGAWNDPTGSRIRLEVYDKAGGLIESVEADQGRFLGIEAPGIARARFVHVQTQSVVGFTIDDLYVAQPTATVPFARPSSVVLVAILLTALGTWILGRRRRTDDLLTSIRPGH